MIKDAEECFEELAKSYPELMEKSGIGDSIGVGVGWFNIIDALCANIYGPFYSAKSALKAAIAYPRDDNGLYLTTCEANYEKELADLPEIVVIKEKFGSLRFYTRNTTDRVTTLVRFAESMSSRTCEECGSPGTIDENVGWLKIRCKAHSTTLPDPGPDLPNGKVSAKFQDNEV